jgi:(1->4)-alpha-D-glucan 1-alpha-D-glucosylmutase
LRIDHIDGLYDPREYLRRLQQGYLLAAGQAAYRRAGGDPQAGPAAAGEAPADLPRWEEVEPWFQRKIEGALSGERPRPLYVAVEKILGPEEPLPADWPVAGTTGYDFLNLASRLLVDPAGLAELGQIYQRFVGERLDFREVAYRSKLLILRVSMSSELHVLAHRLNRISERHRRCRDYTLDTLRVALREILACFPVYRTYICRGEVSQRDRQIVQRAVAQAKRRNPAVAAAVFDFVRDVLLLEQPPDLDDAGRRDREVFVGRFQQVTSPLTAKGVEDTAFYRWLPLVSLNEVGGDPARGPAAVDEFHAGCAERRARHPLSLSATTTHDTKRSEDVRARIHVLAEVPRLWRSALNRFARLNRRHRREADGLPAPSRDDEYLFYQTLVGLWPLEPPDPQALGRLVQRLQGYLEKAAHEAKQRTSWINPHPDYDAAIRQFVAAALDDHPKNRFLAEFRAFHERIVPWGLYTALAQAVLKLACPGVPDVYQGQELWDFSLVDPDNRRPVDFALRQEMLGSLEAELAAGGMARLALARRLAYGPRDPRIKLLVTWRLLRLRREHPELSRSGTYLPLAIEGVHQQHVAAFAWQGSPQGRGEPTVVVVVPRLLARLAAGLQGGLENTGPPLGPAVWADTRLLVEGLAAGRLCNLFTGQEHGLDGGPLPLAELFSDFPVAVLTDLEPHA